ncbi:hypothetical protein OAP56_03200, partial [Rickettsiaceae bacterium]|nr:hypothetical protein [Rickettsiaceae bacterium]
MEKGNKITPKKKQTQHVEHVNQEVFDLHSLAKRYDLKFVDKQNPKNEVDGGYVVQVVCLDSS